MSLSMHVLFVCVFLTSGMQFLCGLVVRRGAHTTRAGGPIFSKDAKFLHFGAVGFRKFVAHDQCLLYLKKIVKCLSIICLRELLAVH